MSRGPDAPASGTAPARLGAPPDDGVERGLVEGTLAFRAVVLRAADGDTGRPG